MTQAQRMNGDNIRGDREKDDYYATPESATNALLNVEKFDGNIWECCCGEGAISDVLLKHGYNVYSSDLVDRNYGDTGVDFLMASKTADNIVTNPPYKNGLDFIKKANKLSLNKMAMIFPLRYLEGKARGLYYDMNPPARIWVFKSRVSMMKGGVEIQASLMAFAWFVWDKKHTGKTELGWI